MAGSVTSATTVRRPGIRHPRRGFRWRATIVLVVAVVLAAAGVLAFRVLTPVTPSFVQGNAFGTSARASTVTSTFGPVARGDLLVGWFAQYNAAGPVRVADDVNGPWTRAPGGLTFQNDTGDVALYYVPNAKSAPSGLTITVTAAAPAFLHGSAADYHDVAVAGPLDQVVSSRGVGTAADSGTTRPVARGELVYSALVTGRGARSAAPGDSQGVPFTPRASQPDAASAEQDIPRGKAGGQHGGYTLGTSTDWYAVTAVFRPATPSDGHPPTPPGGLRTKSVAATATDLAWIPATDDVGVTGYTVYRDGNPVATTDSPAYHDADVTPGGRHVYTVDAFDGAGNHSARSPVLDVIAPTTSPGFVQGKANSPGEKMTETSLALTGPVAQGDLLVGWFAQYNAAGQVRVADDVNGAWTRGPSLRFTTGTGDIALYYVPNSKSAASGLIVTVSADSPTFLPGVVGEYSGVATGDALDQAVAARGVGTGADSGPTAAVGPGELVVGGLITGGYRVDLTPGSSQDVPYVLHAHNGSKSTDLAAVLSGAAGEQRAAFGLGDRTDWYAVCAVFRPR